jgi:hypothetical protein
MRAKSKLGVVAGADEGVKVLLWGRALAQDKRKTTMTPERTATDDIE